MDSRIQKMAEVLVNYSTRIQRGERVLFRGTSPLAQPLMQALTREALKAGGLPFNYLHMSDENRIAAEHGSLEQIAAVNPMLKLMYETADVIIRIEAADNTAELSGFSTDVVQARMRAYGELLNIQMEREANGTLRRCTTLFPTPAYARDANMTLSEYEDFVYRACLLDQDDPVAGWLQLEAEQQRLIDFLRGKQRLHVKGKNIDLQMRIADRTWMNASGRVNFPDGEIFTAPVEDSVNGWVQFTYPAFYNGGVVRGAALHFEQGVITRATAQEGEAFLNAVLDTDAGARRLGEFAIGTNRGVDRFTGHILFDEKIHGTVHMAVGRAYPQTGGLNQSSIHWDMICDMRDGGQIFVDDLLFYQDGEFLV
ncbi:MAG: aminopeptidase [Candidatus Thermofonsia Clade 1 bacterium]|uniref:Aminopeptidase n=1 Tax=Candidatus Thermofonsia Clade 1 bacterium TaxID=2364210 RepID=A0A2M8Q0H9_9CHLR|nr:MAG: aminopeptidase [Candidatus Thermofonsia Clade 1 bacterium]